MYVNSTFDFAAAVSFLRLASTVVPKCRHYIQHLPERNMHVLQSKIYECNHSPARTIAPPPGAKKSRLNAVSPWVRSSALRFICRDGGEQEP